MIKQKNVDIEDNKKELLTKMISKLESQGKSIFRNSKYKLLMNIYNSFENYKKILG